MDDFSYVEGVLCAEGLAATEIAARFGTPTYVYSRATLEGHLARIEAAFSSMNPLICYSIKSCGNVHVLRALVERGAGMDVVSGGELERAWLAGCPMDRVVYAGVGKSEDEIRAALDGRCSLLGERARALAGKMPAPPRDPVGRGPIGWFNIESEQEFETIAAIARDMGVRTHAALRVNPDVDPHTHEYTTTGKKETKFGVDIMRAVRFFEAYGRDDHLVLDAIHLHIGSPVYETGPYVEAVVKALTLIDELAGKGFEVRTLDLGGGFGADYETSRSPAAAEYAAAVAPLLEERVRGGLKLILEPGRTISANAGLLLTRVEYVKEGPGKRFIICDAGMHTLIRPSLYGAFHFVWPVKVDASQVPPKRAEVLDLPGLSAADVVGPICETGDFLARGRMLPEVSRGDLLGVFGAGAYGMVMASNYNAHTLPAEVLVERGRARLIRPRQQVVELLEPELRAGS